MSNLLLLTVSAMTLVVGTIAFTARKAKSEVYCTPVGTGRVCATPTGRHDEYYVVAVGPGSKSVMRVACMGQRMSNWTGKTTEGPETTQAQKHTFAKRFCALKPVF